MRSHSHLSLSLSLFSLIILLALASPALAQKPTPAFSDVTVAAGIDLSQPKLRKYGGPGIADLDRDGYPDLLFCHHDQAFEEIYFNNRDGTFTKAQFGIRHDTHALNPFPISPKTRDMRFSVSVGGNFGLDPSSPFIFDVTASSRAILQSTGRLGLNRTGGRGRSSIYLDLSNGRHPQWLDIIYTNAAALSGINQFAYENLNGNNYAPRPLIGGLAQDSNTFATVTDVDNDGKVEVLGFWGLAMWRVTDEFTLTEITNQVFPFQGRLHGVIAVAEIDFDNDGDFDLYLARHRIGPFLPDIPYDDILLENRDGKYVDVSARAGIPRGTMSHGVTVGDFNNDGWMDVFVTQFKEPDFMLINKGNGIFTRVDNLLTRPNDVNGDNAMAVDYDKDGRVDLISSQGDHIEIAFGGSYRIFKNTLDLTTGTANFIHVRVGVPWDRSCTPMHAVVLMNAQTLWQSRRVGTPGTEVSSSYLETIHFGIGSRTVVDTVYVKYANGFVVMSKNIQAGQTRNLGFV